MNNTIDLTPETFTRLEKLAQGFDTPEAVIIRMLNVVEGKKEVKPILYFEPSDETIFKQRLIEAKEAEVVIYKHDGNREIVFWSANRFSESSNLRGNLWSGLLRDWKKKNILKVELSILLKANSIDERNEIESIKILAQELGLTFVELSNLTYSITENMSNDDLLYDYTLQFDENCDREILDKIVGLEENNGINVGISAFATC
jgi:transcriptional regulator with XRE-family HTH domain